MINMLQMQGLLTPLRNLSFIKCVQYITCIIIYTVACYNVLINYAYSEYIIGKKEELLTYRGLIYTYAAKPLLIFRYVYTCTVLYTVQCIQSVHYIVRVYSWRWCTSLLQQITVPFALSLANFNTVTSFAVIQ